MGMGRVSSDDEWLWSRRFDNYSATPQGFMSLFFDKLINTLQ